MNVIKWLFEKYRSQEMSSVEVNRYMSENQLLHNTSSADTIIDCLDCVPNDSSFQNLVESCRGQYLQLLTSLGATEEELSFTDYINMCLGSKHGKNLIGALKSDQQEKFWSLVSEIQGHLQDS